MNRLSPGLAPALILAGAILVASALVAAAPRASWAAVASPLLLVLALAGADLVDRRRTPRSPRISWNVIFSATILLVACGLLAARDPDRLAAMIPILGSCAAMPILVRDERRRPSCPRA